MKTLNNLKKLVSDKNVVYNWICAVLLIVFFAVQFMPYWTFTVNVPVMKEVPAEYDTISTTAGIFTAEAEQLAKENAAPETDEQEKADVELLCTNCKKEVLNKKEIEEKIADIDPQIIADIKADAAAYAQGDEDIITAIEEKIYGIDFENLYTECPSDDCVCYMSVFNPEMTIFSENKEIDNFDEVRKSSVVDYTWFTYLNTAISEKKDLVADKSGLEDYFNDELSKAGQETPVKTNDIILFPALFMTFALFGILFGILKPKSIIAVLFTLVSGICGILAFLTVPVFKLGSLYVLNIALSVVVFAFAAYILTIKIIKKVKKA